MPDIKVWLRHTLYLLDLYFRLNQVAIHLYFKGSKDVFCDV